MTNQGMKINALPPIDVLRAELNYDPLTGEFKWKRGKQGRNADLSVSGVPRNGYWRIHVNGKTYPAHRIAFAMFHGRNPVGEIDHIDRDPLNNAITNLREVSRSQNAGNRNSWGVSKHPKRISKPYQARIKIDGKYKHLGVFATEAEARAVYLAAQNVAQRGSCDSQCGSLQN